MNLKSYLVNKTEEFEKDISGVGEIYHKYFHRECNIAIGTWLAAGIIEGPTIGYLLTIPTILATDITIRSFKGNHGEKAVSGLIGLTREIYSNCVSTHK